MFVLTLYCPMTPYGVMTFCELSISFGNLYGAFNTRRYTLLHAGFLLLLAVSYGL